MTPAGEPGQDLSIETIDLGAEAQLLHDALTGVFARDPLLAVRMTRIFAAVASEASRGPRFANAISKALRDPISEPAPVARGRRPSNRRNPGPFDPFAVYADGGEGLLRERLVGLTLEQLRDVVAEHSMDTDRLAMKWKDPSRVIDRIVERVADRSAKGSAFRS